MLLVQFFEFLNQLARISLQMHQPKIIFLIRSDQTSTLVARGCCCDLALISHIPCFPVIDLEVKELILIALIVDLPIRIERLGCCLRHLWDSTIALKGLTAILEDQLGVWSVEATWEKLLMRHHDALDVQASLHELHLQRDV